MKKILKWIGIAVMIVVALVIIALPGLYIYEPGFSGGWTKPGISQEEIPAGVDTSVVFENVNVIPMDSERVLEGQTVVIEDGRIVDIGTSGEIEIPANSHIVDGEGKFLIPGLSDMHVHTWGTENDLLVYLANGVTTIRDVGAGPPAILEWRDEIKAGTRVGPSIWAWWPIIKDQARESEWMEEWSSRGGETFVHTPEEAEELVAEMAALGVDGIKAHYIVSSEIYLALLESATQHGLPFDGHAPADHANCRSDKPECVCARADCWNEFRAMGAPALAHVEELVKMVDLVDMDIRQASDEGIRQIAQDAADDGLWATTTIYLFRSIVDQATDLEGTLAAMPEVKYVHPSVFVDKGWAPETNYYGELGTRPWYPNYLAAQEKMVLALNESGALLMSGTDATLALLAPGFSLHNELETLADVGLPPYDVLKTSTYNPALFLGELDEFGTVEVRKRADLVLLEANPLDDITNTQQIAGVMVRGRYFDRADLDTMLDAVAQDYEAVETTQAVLKVAFPVIVILLLVAVVRFIIRRRKASQVSS